MLAQLLLRYQGFKATICGKVNENNFADYMGQDWDMLGIIVDHKQM
jgi:hypothetical protein